MPGRVTLLPWPSTVMRIMGLVEAPKSSGVAAVAAKQQDCPPAAF